MGPRTPPRPRGVAAALALASLIEADAVEADLLGVCAVEQSAFTKLQTARGGDPAQCDVARLRPREILQCRAVARFRNDVQIDLGADAQNDRCRDRGRFPCSGDSRRRRMPLPSLR